MSNIKKSSTTTRKKEKKFLTRDALIELALILKSGVGVGVACRTAGIYENEFYAHYRRDPIIEQAMEYRFLERSMSNFRFYGEPQPKKVRKKSSEKEIHPEELPLGSVKV